MPLRNTKLPLEAKQQIVRLLAQRERHAAIVEQIHQRFGILVNRKAVAHYNPRLNSALDPSLQLLHEETAAAFWREAERKADERMEKRWQECEAQRLALRDKMRRELGLT